MMSAIHGEEIVIVESKQKDGLNIAIAINYHKFMGGVDVADKLFVY